MEGQPIKKETCGICYDKILTGNIVKTLECKHEICKDCFYKLKIGKCPYCRHEIKIPSIKIKQPLTYFSYQEVNQIVRHDLPVSGRSVDSYVYNMEESRVGRRINRRYRRGKGLDAIIDDYQVDIEENTYYYSDEMDDMMFELELS